MTNLSGKISILSAAFKSDKKTVLLTTASQLPYTKYWLTINGVFNTTGSSAIAANSQVTFTNSAFTVGYIRCDYFFNLDASSSVASLTNSSKYPNGFDGIYFTEHGHPF